MRSPLSSIAANLVMQELERVSLNKLKFTLDFHYRYVDDIALSIPKQNFDTLLSIFNEFHSRLKFTMEVGDTQFLRFDLNKKKKQIDV